MISWLEWMKNRNRALFQKIMIPDLQSKAEILVKSLLNENGFRIVRFNESQLVVEADSGQRSAIFIQTFDRPNAQSIKVHTREFNHEFRADVWIALVVAFPPDKDLFDYLIPTTVFEEPDERLFFHNDIPQNDYFSNVEIRVFTTGAEELSEFALPNQIKHLR